MKDYFPANGAYSDVDTLFVFGGTNDSWANVPVGSLKYADWSEDDLKQALPAFCYMLAYLKENNPNTRIVNIINTGLKSEITSGMVTACSHYGVKCVQLSAFSTQSGHPTNSGMTSIKDQLIAALYAE